VNCKRVLILSLAVAFIGCAPRGAPIYTFQSLETARALALIEPFRAVLKDLEIRVEGGRAFRYDGDDDRAFLAAADAFYMESPGFCPLRDGAFHFLEGRAVFMTIAAKELQVRVFVYDRTERPKLEYTYLNGSSMKKLEVTPCRTASSGGVNN
jgi:hypothetical protein